MRFFMRPLALILAITSLTMPRPRFSGHAVRSRASF
jgi:hypothetical protein